MTAISCTELKTELKHYGEIIASGEPVLVKRPKKENNWVIIQEDEYRRLQRLTAYCKELEIMTKQKKEDTSIETNNDAIDDDDFEPQPIKKRGIFGCCKGMFNIPDDFDFCNDEIWEDFFNEEEDLLLCE